MRRGLLILFSRFKIQKFLGPIQRSTIKNSHDAYILLCAVYFSLRAKGWSQHAPTGNFNRAFSIERFFLLCADFRLCCPCFAAWGWLIKDVKCDISSLILLRRIHGNDVRRGEVDRGSHLKSPMLGSCKWLCSATTTKQSNVKKNISRTTRMYAAWLSLLCSRSFNLRKFPNQIQVRTTNQQPWRIHIVVAWPATCSSRDSSAIVKVFTMRLKHFPAKL